MNPMVIGFPLRMLAGMITLGLAVGVIPPLVRILIPRALELAARTAYAFQ